MIRKIIKINEEKCNGCGACANACHEGAIEMVNGKAKLTRENFCDGFGDCLPNCPTGAITFEEREAPEYDEKAVKAAQEEKKMNEHKHHGGCPGSKMMTFDKPETEKKPVVTGKPISRLNQWPVQIKLLPVKAPFYDGAKLLIAADCTAYAYANMHEDFMKGKVTIIGCPKLDMVDYTEKLTEIIKNNDIKSVTIVRMATGFKKIDVRGIQGNFFQGLKKQAMKTPVGEGLEIVQSFDPIPLYDVMEGLGFERHTVQVNENEFHAYFYRTENQEDTGDIPMRPAALTNMPLIDEELGKVAVQFWDLTWNDGKRHLPYEIRLLLSLTNAVGAGRMRQATRELVKAYIHGLDSAALDDVFELFAWNQGIGYFSSEIGPSTLFAAYKTIKNMERKGKDREDISAVLMDKFGEKNPDVKVM